MADIGQVLNQVKAYRQLRGWSQAELAGRAGISRAAVSAIEMGRLVPSVAAALALAGVLDCSVEDLFGRATVRQTGPEWAWPPDHTPCRYWHAEMRGRHLYYPVEPTAAGVIAHDGLFQANSFTPSGEADPSTTLVMASCDPAVGLLAAEFARTSGFRLLTLQRSSRQALELLGKGLVHVAGVHFATADEPDANDRLIRQTLGPGHRLLRVARWQEGLAVSTAARFSSVRAVLRADLRWVGREPGSAARRCLDTLRSDRPPPSLLAHNHQTVADAVRCGWADVGVCHRLVSEDAGLRFLPIQEEGFDLCYPAAIEGDPRLAALLRAVRSSPYRRLLGELPGFVTTEAGQVRSVN